MKLHHKILTHFIYILSLNCISTDSCLDADLGRALEKLRLAMNARYAFISLNVVTPEDHAFKVDILNSCAINIADAQRELDRLLALQKRRRTS